MEGADNRPGAAGQRLVGDPFLHHHPQAQPYRRRHSFPQRRRRLAGLLLRQDLDGLAVESRRLDYPFYPPGEHRYPDLRCGVLWPRF